MIHERNTPICVILNAISEAYQNPSWPQRFQACLWSVAFFFLPPYSRAFTTGKSILLTTKLRLELNFMEDPFSAKALLPKWDMTAPQRTPFVSFNERSQPRYPLTSTPSFVPFPGFRKPR